MTAAATLEAIVLKRKDYGEADRIVALFTKERGKLTLLAKGARKITSKRLSSLEVGTHLKAQVITSKSGFNILSQTLILDSFESLKTDLASITRLYQLLEVVDDLTGEDQENPEVYHLLLDTLTQLSHPQTDKKTCLLQAFKQMTQVLGFSAEHDLSELDLKSRIESIAAKKLHSKDFLTTKNLNGPSSKPGRV